MKILKKTNIKIKKIKMTCDSLFYPPVIEPLPNVKNFLMGIFGSPSAGKTNLILSLLQNKDIFKKRFDIIIWCSPSQGTVNIPLDDNYKYDYLPLEEIHEMINDFNDDDDDKYNDILIIFDDLINDINDNKEMLKLCFNRRHLMPYGSVNIIIVSQKLTSMKKKIRSSLSHTIMFQPNTEGEMKAYKDEFLIGLNHNQLNELMDITYNTPHDFLYIKLLENKNKRYYPNFHIIEL